MKKILMALSALTMAAAPAAAHKVYDRHGYSVPHNHGRYYRGYNDYRYDRRYSYDRPSRYWRGRDGRVYCRRGDGTVGLLVGGAVGAIVGGSLDDRGRGTTETVIGGALGALLGREITRGRARCR